QPVIVEHSRHERFSRTRSDQDLRRSALFNNLTKVGDAGVRFRRRYEISGCGNVRNDANILSRSLWVYVEIMDSQVSPLQEFEAGRSKVNGSVGGCCRVGDHAGGPRAARAAVTHLHVPTGGL